MANLGKATVAGLGAATAIVAAAALTATAVVNVNQADLAGKNPLYGTSNPR